MIRPSSAFLSLWRFRFKNTVIVGIIALSMVVLMYANLLVQSFDISGQRIGRFFEKMTILSYSSSIPVNRKVQIKNEVRRLDPKATIIEGQEQPISFQGFAAEVFSYVAFMPEDNYQEFLDIQGWNLTQGRLPSDGTDEIALTEAIMVNQGYQLGDQIGKQVNPTDYLNGRFTIVGVLDGNDTIGGLGNYVSTSTEGSNALFVKLEDETEANLSAINDLPSQFPEVFVLDSNFYDRRFAQSVRQLTSFLWSLNIVVASAISASLALFIYIMYSGRSKEFGAFLALGFTKGWLRRKLLVENFIIAVIAYIFGLRLNVLITRLINNVLVVPRGLTPFPTSLFPFLQFENALFSAIVPGAFFLASYIISIVFINRLNLLKIINSQ
jgi:ABC-type antimicrobial peptide transport system permease subunit